MYFGWDGYILVGTEWLGVNNPRGQGFPFPPLTPLPFQASSKGKNEIRDLERQMLKAHKKDVSSQFKLKKGENSRERI